MAQQFVISKIFRIATAFCVLFIMAKPASAQQLSTYEQKRYNLAKETINKMGDRLGSEKEAFLLLVGLHIAGETMANGDFKSKLEEMYYWEEIIESASNGSSSFWGNDIAKNLTYGYSLRDIYRLWKEQRKAIDKTRTQADIDREYKIKPTTGTIDQMISLVRIEFGKWAKRGTYEKTVNYQNRLNTYGIDVFDRICDSIIGKTNIWRSSPAWESIEEHYDPDKEQYLATVFYGDDSYRGKLSIVCKISPDRARYYKVGDVTKMNVDGKWLVPVEAECVRNTPGEYTYRPIPVHMKTTFTTNSTTEPLRICFRDIKFSYSEISDKLKNHCFTSGELQAKFDTLYSLKENLKSRLQKLSKSIYWGSDFEKKFNSYAVKNVYDQKNYKEIQNLLNEEYVISRNTYKIYENTLHSISEIIDNAELELYDLMTTSYLRGIGASGTYYIIKKASIDNNQITFDVPQKGQVQGLFYKNKLKNSNGELYAGVKKNDVRCTEDEALMLLRRDSDEGPYIMLIVNKKEVYILSSKVYKQLYKHGIFQ